MNPLANAVAQGPPTWTPAAPIPLRPPAPSGGVMPSAPPPMGEGPPAVPPTPGCPVRAPQTGFKGGPPVEAPAGGLRATPREGKAARQRVSSHGLPPAKRKRGGCKQSSNTRSVGQQQQQQQQRRQVACVTSAELGRRGRDRLLLDYAQHFVDTGERPQNFIRDVEPEKRFNAYFRLKELMELKRQVIRARATPAQCIRADLRTFDWATLPCQFDVILVDPPWAEYAERSVGAQRPTEDLRPWTVQDIMALPIEQIAESQSFCFLWCGVKHLEEARDVLSKWGFRRCEDICWVKSNKGAALRLEAQKSPAPHAVLRDESSFLQRTTEHCLVGIKGLVRRSQDGHLIHANLDADVIVSEEPQDLFSTEKPAELYDIIERFCLGRRRLELFGLQRNVRDGWLTIGSAIRETNFSAQLYASWFAGDTSYPEAQTYQGGRLLGSTEEIESLRPKSPPREIRPTQQQQQ
ncbi:N6-adenosine-methyltransferase non-catalytic subunit [Cyclospora cayetanensis]|uniref:N6-adenosine-methyltransferase non-catalytic subunit n=1 Tax=Cyclospora cayetanensis TaxID=88456 RepID=A0A6P6S0I0_9EIME|nr:N6-adenosine-methyltransferase non-catalytic subunit [Cyclospora cayetanensis]